MKMIENTYWVDPNKLLAGPYPRHAMMEEQTRHQLAWLCEQGITCIIDLTGPGERSAYRQDFEQVCRRYNIDGIWERFPITDFGLPDKYLMRDILDEIQRNIESGGKVYLHCYGGIGRTGTVAACYLVEQGLSSEEALAKLQELRSHTPNASYDSPETEAQRNFVLGWHKAK
ncbi:MAG: dual specificity protein phosphatase family protein [Anaerolineaceae bacterium]|nr:dual specificity protein phosphatase family protein [Anaerolineaceae bacterium]